MIRKPFTPTEVDRLPVPVYVLAGFMLAVLEDYARAKGLRAYIPTYDCRCMELLPAEHV